MLPTISAHRPRGLPLRPLRKAERLEKTNDDNELCYEHQVFWSHEIACQIPTYPC